MSLMRKTRRHPSATMRVPRLSESRQPCGVVVYTRKITRVVVRAYGRCPALVEFQVVKRTLPSAAHLTSQGSDAARSLEEHHDDEQICDRP